MKWISASLAAALLLSANIGLALTLEEKVDRLFRSYQGNVPGASIGIYKDGEILLEKGYGNANHEDQVEADEFTNYRLASVTKAFTAMAIMILKERGQLSFDDRLVDTLDGFPSYANAIRIRHLLGHTAGLRDYESHIPRNQQTQLKDSDVVTILKQRSSTYFTPGSQYKYSNSGYATLAEIVAKVSGQSFASFLMDNIFVPLGMNETVAYEKGVSEISNRAYGYSRSGGYYRTDQSITSAVLGDGGVYTSARDYFLWDQALYGEQLVSKETLDEAFTRGRLNNGSRTSYGFGWMLGSYRGNKRISHTGSTIGFRSSVQRFPEENLTILIMINREGSSPWNIAEDVADLIL